MGEERHNASVGVSGDDEAPVRYAGQPVPVGRSQWSSPWIAPPKKLQQSQQLAPGVYRGRASAAGAVEPVASGALTPRESLARDFGGLRQITVANPAPRSGKTVAVDALHAAFRQARADVVAWDTEGLAEGEFGRERDRLGRSYKVLIVDTAGDAAAALDATDQLVVAVDPRLESVRAAEAMLAGLEDADQAALARNAVVVITAARENGATSPISNRDAATAQRFSGRTRAVFDLGEADAWSRIAQAVADGL